MQGFEKEFIKEVVKGYLQDRMGITIDKNRPYPYDQEEITVTITIEGEIIEQSTIYLDIPG